MGLSPNMVGIPNESRVDWGCEGYRDSWNQRKKMRDWVQKSFWSDILGDGISSPDSRRRQTRFMKYEMIHCRFVMIGLQWVHFRGPQVKKLTLQPFQSNIGFSKQDENSIRRFLNDLAP